MLQRAVMIFHKWLANTSQLCRRDMSPAAGSPQTLAHRSRLFSLGIDISCQQTTVEGNLLKRFTQRRSGNARDEFKVDWLAACANTLEQREVDTAESCVGRRVTLRWPRRATLRGNCFSKVQITVPKALPALPASLQPNEYEEKQFQWWVFASAAHLTKTS